jgi:ATP-dependent helicase IRC3
MPTPTLEKQEKFCRIYDLTKPQLSSKNPFPHQNEALGKLNLWFKQKDAELGGILVLPTGGGKTFTAWHFICNNVLPEGYKVLWLAHTHHLLEQAFYGLESEVGSIRNKNKDKKQLKVRVVSGTRGHFRPAEIEPSDDVIICTLQTITRADQNRSKQVEAFLKSAGKKLFVVFDEAHHSPAPSYCKFIMGLRKRFSDMRLLGLTATPLYSKEEQRGWLKKLFPQEILYQVSAEKLIADKVLAKPIFEQSPTEFKPEFDEAKYKEWLKNYRDLPAEIVTKLAENKERNDFIAGYYAKHKEKYGKTIIFADRWFQCEYLLAALKGRGIKADVVYSHVDANPGDADARNKRTEDENKAAIRRFKNNETQVLINVRILTEGTDIPDVQTVFLTRQTTSKILMTQMVGRALRGTKAGAGTDTAYIVSFVDDWQQAIDWAEFQLPDGGTEDSPPSTQTILELVSIDLVRRLSEAMYGRGDSIIDDEPFLSFMPIGWYRVRFETLAEGSGDSEEVERLITVFDHEKESYEDFLNFLAKVNQTILDPLAEPDINFDDYQEQIEQWQNEFFVEQKNIGGNLLTNLFNLARHVAQKRRCPDWFEFKQRNDHDLDQIALDLMNRLITEKEKNQLLKDEYDRDDRYWKVIYRDYKYFRFHYNVCVNWILEGNLDKPNNGSPPWTGKPPLPPEPPEKVKKFVRKRDREHCLCCGATRGLEIDHVKSREQGGDHSEANLQTLCKICNGFKNTKEISFRNSCSPLKVQPSTLPELKLPKEAQYWVNWKPFLIRTVNFFYQSAVVQSVNLELSANGNIWHIYLKKGNDPYWLQPHLEEFQKRIQAHRKQPYEHVRVAVTTSDVTLLANRF